MFLPLSIVGWSIKPTEYYFDPRIHTFGNRFAGGQVHASLARFATHAIDVLAYDGRDVRRELLDAHVRPGERVVDLCCGTGTSTRYGGVGVDTSPCMLREARWRRGPTGSFVQANAETFGDDDAYDVATVFFALHEMPEWARRRVLANAARIATKRVVVCDISPRYAPSKLMLTGEPYLLDYQNGIENELAMHHPHVFNECVQGRVLVAVFDAS